jgi:uncharacterized protein (DUF1501 family)
MTINRRHFLAAAGASLLASTQLSLAALPTEQRTIVLVLRGAMDGLTAVPPLFDKQYKILRPTMAVKESEAFSLDARFGLHPELKAFHALWQARQLAVIQAVATPYRERSHFDAQNLLEGGGLKPYGQKDGWLNRALALLAPRSKPWGLAIGAGTPFIVSGTAPVTTYAPTALPAPDSEFLALAQKIMASDAKLSAALVSGQEGQAMAAAAGGDMMSSGPRQNSRVLAEVVGKMLLAPDGPRLAVMDIGGWDTHVNQPGRLPTVLRNLNAAVASLQKVLAPVWDKTAIVIVSEFGRTVAANGSNGTDHGTATAAFVLGGAVHGGQMIAKWPGLDRLYQSRDLAPTTDLRSVLKAVLAGQWGLSETELASRVFPGSPDVVALSELIKGEG